MLPSAIAVIALAIGYLFGSIPFGMILTRMAGTQDLRSIGSGNIGATNVLRTGRKGLAAATLLGDMLKGTAAVLVAGLLWRTGAAMAAGARRFSRPSISGVAEIPWRQGRRDLYRRAARPVLAGSAGLLRDLAARRVHDALLVAVSADRESSPRRCCCGGSDTRSLRCCLRC